MGKAELIEPFSDTYNEHAQIKKIPIEALKKHSNVEYAHIDGTTLHLQIITPQTRNTKESDETSLYRVCAGFGMDEAEY